MSTAGSGTCRCDRMGAVADHQRHAPIRQHDGHRGEHGLIDLSRRRDPGTDSPENSSDDYTRFVTVLNTTPGRRPQGGHETPSVPSWRNVTQFALHVAEEPWAFCSPERSRHSATHLRDGTLVSYPSSAPHNSRHGPLVDFVPTGGKLSALAYATVSLFDVDRHWSIGPRQERVDLCHVFPGRHTSVLPLKTVEHSRGRHRLCQQEVIHAQGTPPGTGHLDGGRTASLDLAGPSIAHGPAACAPRPHHPGLRRRRPRAASPSACICATTVCKWRTRFLADRIDGLTDEPRPGAPRRITDAQVEDVVVRTLESTPRAATHWSTRAMARATA